MAKRRVTFAGNCQAWALARIYQQIAPEDDIVAGVQSPVHASPDEMRKIEEADVLVFQLWAATPDFQSPGAARQTILFPHISIAWLYPYEETKRHPLDNTGPTDFCPFIPQVSDTYLLKALRDGADPDQTVRDYLSIDVARARTLDRRYELHMEAQRARDLQCGVEVADFIDANFRNRSLFRNTHHPRGELTMRMANAIFPQLGVDPAAISVPPGGPYHPIDSPVHPAVAEHFGVGWAREARYQQFHCGAFTPAEWWGRYMRFDGS